MAIQPSTLRSPLTPRSWKTHLYQLVPGAPVMNKGVRSCGPVLRRRVVCCLLRTCQDIHPASFVMEVAEDAVHHPATS